MATAKILILKLLIRTGYATHPKLKCVSKKIKKEYDEHLTVVGEPDEDPNFWDLLCKYTVNRQGQIHGIYTEREVENGTLLNRYNYRNGELCGLYECWNSNGILVKQCYYYGDDFLLCGLYKEWDKNGTLWKRCHYRDGQKEGIYEEWHINKKLSKQCHYVRGLKHGLYKKWDIDGNLIKRSHYDHGELHSLYEEWDEENLSKQCQCHCVHGKRYELCKEWHINKNETLWMSVDHHNNVPNT